MLIYYILIAYILVLPLVVSFFVKSNEKKQHAVALFGMLGVFLILSLKATSVGIDIKGYEAQYNLSRAMDWLNFDYVYFEKGYILLEKIFSKSGVSFQLFTAFVYGFECFAWYKLISKYSSDAMLSLMFFVCYQFFVFSASGLRQSIAMSICIFSFILIEKGSKVSIIIGSLLIIPAVSIHSSSFVFLYIAVVILLSRRFKKITPAEMIIGAIVTVLLRQTVWSFVDRNFHTVEVGAVIQFGGSFVFMAGIFILSLYTYNNYYQIGLLGRRRYIRRENKDIPLIDTIQLRISLSILFAFLLLSGGKMLRAQMYFTMLMVPTFPNVLAKYRREQRFVMKLFFILFLLYLFYTDTLAVNQLNISNYKFFWQ